jgi:hypothetical protein
MACLYGGRAEAEWEVARAWSHVQYLDIQELESYECEYTSFFVNYWSKLITNQSCLSSLLSFLAWYLHGWSLGRREWGNSRQSTNIDPGTVVVFMTPRSGSTMLRWRRLLMYNSSALLVWSNKHFIWQVPWFQVSKSRSLTYQLKWKFLLLLLCWSVCLPSEFIIMRLFADLVMFISNKFLREDENLLSLKNSNLSIHPVN